MRGSAWALLLLVLVLQACAAKAPPLAATVTENGAPVAVEHVGSFGSGRDWISLGLQDGRRLCFDFERPPRAGSIGFGDLDGDIPALRAGLSAAPAPGTDILPELCQSTPDTEGELVVRAISWGEDGYVDGLDATFTVHLLDCGLPGAAAREDLTFVVELPGQ